MPITTSVITGTVAHKHSASGGSGDGGKLATGGLGGDTSFDLSNGSLMFSNGTSIDELVIGGSGTVLTEAGGVPTWSASSGVSAVTQVITPTHATTYSGVTNQAITNGSATLNNTGGVAILNFDFVGEKSSTGYIYFGWTVAGVDSQTGAILISTTNVPAGGSMTYFTPDNGDLISMHVRMNSGTTTIYSTTLSGNTAGNILELG